jgi:hypothetical protein
MAGMYNSGRSTALLPVNYLQPVQDLLISTLIFANNDSKDQSYGGSSFFDCLDLQSVLNIDSNLGELESWLQAHRTTQESLFVQQFGELIEIPLKNSLIGSFLKKLSGDALIIKSVKPRFRVSENKCNARERLLGLIPTLDRGTPRQRRRQNNSNSLVYTT